jgi:hypothetical protein
MNRRSFLKGLAGVAAGLVLPSTLEENVEATRRFWPGGIPTPSTERYFPGDGGPTYWVTFHQQIPNEFREFTIDEWSTPEFEFSTLAKPIPYNISPYPYPYGEIPRGLEDMRVYTLDDNLDPDQAWVKDDTYDGDDLSLLVEANRRIVSGTIRAAKINLDAIASLTGAPSWRGSIT